MRNAAKGVGIGYRRELAHALFASPSSIDFVEVVAESCRDAAARREIRAVAEIWPVVPHGVKLSLGSAEGLDMDRARQFAELARDLRAPVVSEHISFVRAGGREIGHLTELPMTREVVRVVARNVAALRRLLPDVPLLLENVARSFVWSEHELTEGEFHHLVTEATGCELLLDVGNLYANAVNAGLDPAALLASYPLDRVAMMHVAGGVLEHGFYFDTHAHAVPEPVFDLVAKVLEERDVPVLLERDAGYDAHAAIFEEVARLRTLGGRAPAPRIVARPGIGDDFAASSSLIVAQSNLAEALTCAATTGASVALLRARSVLDRKRADDALPLLSELSRCLAPNDALALGKIAETPRLPTMTAVADAMRVAAAAREVPDLARAAVKDAALLRARFRGGPERPRPRAGPYVGRELVHGHVVWVVKGFGAGAPVRMIERGARP